MRKSRHISRALLALAVLALLTGCGRGMGDLQQWVAQEKAKKGASLEPLPVIKHFETFEYVADDRRDPFAPGFDEEEMGAEAGPRPDENRPREPLEMYTLDGLSMVGTIGLDETIEALVKDPDGVIHRVRGGNYLGQNYGRITVISEDRIELAELVPNGAGGWMERQAKIALADSK